MKKYDSTVDNTELNDEIDTTTNSDTVSIESAVTLDTEEPIIRFSLSPVSMSLVATSATAVAGGAVAGGAVAGGAVAGGAVAVATTGTMTAAATAGTAIAKTAAASAAAKTSLTVATTAATFTGLSAGAIAGGGAAIVAGLVVVYYGSQYTFNVLNNWWQAGSISASNTGNAPNPDSGDFITPYDLMTNFSSINISPNPSPNNLTSSSNSISLNTNSASSTTADIPSEAPQIVRFRHIFKENLRKLIETSVQLTKQSGFWNGLVTSMQNSIKMKSYIKGIKLITDELENSSSNTQLKEAASIASGVAQAGVVFYFLYNQKKEKEAKDLAKAFLDFIDYESYTPTQLEQIIQDIANLLAFRFQHIIKKLSLNNRAGLSSVDTLAMFFSISIFEYGPPTITKGGNPILINRLMHAAVPKEPHKVFKHACLKTSLFALKNKTMDRDTLQRSEYHDWTLEGLVLRSPMKIVNTDIVYVHSDDKIQRINNPKYDYQIILDKGTAQAAGYTEKHTRLAQLKPGYTAPPPKPLSSHSFV